MGKVPATKPYSNRIATKRAAAQPPWPSPRAPRLLVLRGRGAHDWEPLSAMPRQRPIARGRTEHEHSTLSIRAKTWSLELPDSVLKVIARIDNVLCSIAPSALAMGRSMALQKELQS